LYSFFFSWCFCRCLLSPSALWYSLALFLYWLVFVLDDLSVDETGVLKLPSIIIFRSSLCMSSSICFINLGAPTSGMYKLTILSSWWVVLLLIVFSPLLLFFWFEVGFVRYKYSYSICLMYHFFTLSFSLLLSNISLSL
jgi:hypothetical protein